MRQRGALFKYIFPFLFLVVFGVAIVLGVQVYKFFYSSSIKSYASMYIVSGQAQIKMWGSDSFSKAYSGMNVLQGDELSVVRDSKVVIKFFDDTLMRISGGSDIIFEEIVGNSSDNRIKIVLKNGEAWVNRTSVAASNTDFSILSGYASVKPTGAIFDIGSNKIFVISGSVIVDIYNEDMTATVDEFMVKTDQTALFDEDKLSKFWGFQSPNVVTDGLPDDFKNSVWFPWNMKEDNDPTDFSDKIEKVESGDVVEDGDGDDESVDGVVDSGVDEDNAVDVGGVIGIGDSVGAGFPEKDGSEPTNLDLGTFSDPKILKIGGQSWDPSMSEKGIIVKTSPVKVEGVVSGASSVVIDGYTLQKFIPQKGNESFVYSLKPEFGNLKEGENIYEVYALSPDGLKSSLVRFKVMYEPEASVID